MLKQLVTVKTKDLLSVGINSAEANKTVFNKININHIKDKNIEMIRGCNNVL